MAVPPQWQGAVVINLWSILLLNSGCKIFGWGVHVVSPKWNVFPPQRQDAMFMLFLQNGTLLINGTCAIFGCVVHALPGFILLDGDLGILLLNSGCAIFGVCNLWM